MTRPAPSAANARAETASSGMTGDAANANMTCPAPVLEIGVFFDGTGNNRMNSRNGAVNMPGSYGNAESNVALLEPLYYRRDQDIRNACGQYATRYDRIYVAGIGTVTGEDDSGFGAGTGRGDTGVENRVFETAIQIGNIIDRLSPGVEPTEIIMDVFGFSRGASAARHFVNAFNRGNLTYYRVVNVPRMAYLPEGRNIRFRFIGLFDTVASIQIGAGSDNHGSLDMDLSNGSADHIYHLTAEHEVRLNFPLTDTRGAGRSREMPGAHSDIGGGYRAAGDDVIIERPRSYIETTHARAAARLDAELARLNATKTAAAATWVSEGYIQPADIDAAFTYEATPIRQFIIPGGMFTPSQVDYSFEIHTKLNRPWVRPDLAKISLHLMHKTAQDSSVPFEDINEGRSQYAFPDDPVFEAAARTMVSGGSPNAAQKAHLVRNYAHHSSHYTYLAFYAPYPMETAPGRRRRVIANRPGRAE